MVTFFDTFSLLNYGTCNLSEQGRLRGWGPFDLLHTASFYGCMAFC